MDTRVVYVLHTSNPLLPRHQMVSSTGGMSMIEMMSPTYNNIHSFSSTNYMVTMNIDSNINSQ